MPKKPLIDILFCVPGKQFSDLFLQSWSMTLGMLHEEGITCKLANGYSAELAGLRNNIADADCNAAIHFWLDSDMVWSPNHIIQLLKHEEDIVSGVYKQIDNTWTHRPKEGLPESGLQEADYCGFGFVRYDVKVLEKMTRPYFFYNTALENGWDGEDVSWCKNAQNAGFKVHVDYDCRIGHEKRQIL